LDVVFSLLTIKVMIVDSRTYYRRGIPLAIFQEGTVFELAAVTLIPMVLDPSKKNSKE
jgi:hypothetical protein